MRTKASVDGIITRIWETGGLTADMEDDINKLRAEFDERQGILDKYGEAYDGEDEEYDWKPRAEYADKNEPEEPEENGSDIVIPEESAEYKEMSSEGDETVLVTTEDTPDWKAKYELLKQRYIDIFMHGTQMTTPEEIMQEMEEDLKEETKPMGLDQLLARADRAYLKEQEKMRRNHNA